METYMNPMETLGYLLQHTSSIMYRQSDQILQERLGIGMSQFKLLMMLQSRPNVQQRVLADSLGQTEASVSRQIKLLCERGMLEVKVNAESRREHITVTTPKGLKITEAAKDVLQEYHGPVFSQFSEKQQRQLSEMLVQMHAIICQEGKHHACERPFNI